MNLPIEVLHTLREAMKADAVKQNENYPQYDGYFDNHILYRVRKATAFKSHRRVEIGDFVIGQAEPKLNDCDWEYYVTIFNHESGFNCSMPLDNLETM